MGPLRRSNVCVLLLGSNDGILAIVNLLALLMLFPTLIRILTDYKEQLKAGAEHPVFDASKFPDLDIDLEAWKIKKKES